MTKVNLVLRRSKKKWTIVKRLINKKRLFFFFCLVNIIFFFKKCRYQNWNHFQRRFWSIFYKNMSIEWTFSSINYPFWCINCSMSAISLPFQRSWKRWLSHLYCFSTTLWWQNSSFKFLRMAYTRWDQHFSFIVSLVRSIEISSYAPFSFRCRCHRLQSSESGHTFALKHEHSQFVHRSGKCIAFMT